MSTFEEIVHSQFNRAEVDPDVLLRITMAWESLERLRENDAPACLLEEGQRILEKHVAAFAVWYRARVLPW